MFRRIRFKERRVAKKRNKFLECRNCHLQNLSAIFFAAADRLRQRGLFNHYRHTLEKLGAAKGLLGLIFGKVRDNSR